MATLMDLREMVVLIAVISFIAAASAIGLADFQLSVQDTGTTLNESQTVTAGTLFTLNSGWTVTSIEAIRNATSAALNTGEFTLIDAGINGYTVNVTNTSKAGGAAATFFIDYTFNDQDEEFNITQNGLVGVDNSTSFLDTTGTIAGVAVLIGIVLAAFTIGRRE